MSQRQRVGGGRARRLARASAPGSVLLVALLAGSVQAQPVSVPTTRLTMHDDHSAPIDLDTRTITFEAETRTAAPANRIAPPALGSAADPTRAGGAFVVENSAGSGERVQVPLPAQGWSLLGSAAAPMGYIFRRTSPATPITRVVVVDDLISVRGGGASWDYPLDQPAQHRIGVRLQLGNAAWCADAPARSRGTPASTGADDRVGRFAAQPKAAPPTTCPVAAPRFTLNVTQGWGSGTYAAAETVHVWAAVRPQDQVVTGWSGDADLLADPAEWHTTLTMPLRDVSLAAAIVDRPTTLMLTQYGGTTATPKRVFSRIPDNPSGLILFLHGTGGDADFITRTESFAVALRALENGYGVLGTEAEEAVAGDLDADGKLRWDAALTATNIDFANLNALVATLRASGTIAPTTPLFAVGMSNGGNTAVSLGAVGSSSIAAAYPALRFAAVVSHCAQGRAAAVAVTTTPTAWFMCARDDNDMVSNAAAQADSAALAARGVPTQYRENPPSPLYDQRFLRVSGLDQTTSQAVAAELRTAGFVGPDGFFVTPTGTIQIAVAADPSLAPALAALAPGARSRVFDQVSVMQAEHQMYSDLAAAAVAFFDAHHP